MLQTPDRIAAVIEAIEQGKPVDFKQVETLQALDVAQLGRRFVEEAIQRDEEFDRIWADGISRPVS